MKKSNVLVIGDVKHAEEDIIGKKFNRWTILSIKEPVRGTSRKCICRCECGKEKDVDLYTVRKGTSRSCGCETARGNEKVPGHANCTVSYHNYKHQARYRNINFELTRDQYKKIVEQPCFYCHKNHSKTVSDRSNGVYVCNGIDRINSRIGYTVDNCVPCCKNCNYAKNTLDQDEFKSLICSIYHNWGKHG